MDFEYNEYDDYDHEYELSEPMAEEMSNQIFEEKVQIEAPPEIKKRAISTRRKTVIDVKDVYDPSIESLIKTSLQGNLVEFLNDPQKVIQRLSQLYMHVMTIINEAQADGFLAFESDIEILLKMFFQGLHIALHTDLLVQTNDYVIALPLDKVRLLGILKSTITKHTCRQSTREYLIRLLTFYCLPQKFFSFGIHHGDCQQIILSKLSQHFTDNNEEFDPLDLELTASIFLCNVNAVTEQVKSIIWIMNIYLESILESEHQTHETNVQILIIIKLFAVFTLNRLIKQHFHSKKLHIMLYNTLKFSTPIFSNKLQGVHYEDHLRKMIVILIGQISAIQDQDDRFAQNLYSDLLTVIDSQTFNYAYDVINPLLNVKSDDTTFICIHTESRFSEFWSIRKMIEKNLEQKQNLGLEVAKLTKIRLQSEILSLKFKLEFLKRFSKSWTPTKSNQAQLKQEMSDIEQIENDQFEEVPKEPKISELRPSQNQSQEWSLSGNWVPLLRFSAQNPIFGSQHFFEVINQKQYLLFIFEIQQELKRIQICIYSEKAIKQDQRKVCKDSQKSFYCINYENSFSILPGNNTEDKILFEMTSSDMIFKFQHSRFLMIDFKDLQSCRLLLPKSCKFSLNDERVSLLSAEIFQFNYDENPAPFTDHQLQLLNQIDSYEQLIQQALIYTRLVPVRMISSSIKIEELQESYKNHYGKCFSFLDDDLTIFDKKETFDHLKDSYLIVDLHIQLQSDCNSFQLPKLKQDIRIERPLRNNFIRIQGYEKLALKIRQQLLKSDKLIKEYFIDFAEWLSIPGFAHQIAADEDLLHRFFMIYQEVQQMFHEGTYMFFKSLNDYVKKSVISIKSQIMNSQLLDSLLLRTITYLKKLIHDNLESVQPFQSVYDHELKEIFQGQKPTKGMPKGIGYGDSHYNPKKFQTPQSASKELIQNLEGKALRSESASQYQNLIIGEIFSIIHQVISSVKIKEEEVNHIMNSNIVVVMRTILYVNSVTDMIQNPQAFLPIIKLLGVLAESDMLIELFVQEKSQSMTLYRIMESLKLQTKLILDNQFKQEQREEKLQFINTIKGVALYVERRLVENRLVEIRFIKKEEQKLNLDDKLKLHQFYNQLMKPLAVRDVLLLHQDNQWVAKMGAYQAYSSDSPAKINRIISELSDLAEHLPIEATNSIFLRYDQNKMDCMRFIIFGATGTPYAHGAFQFEMLFDQDYPNRPPKVLLSTTGNGKFRFNPNLYACGKVCLSLLGTWGDNWISNVSTILQILISIMSMVMSEYVLFNEPGWEKLMGTEDGEQKNRGYCNLVKLNNIRYAMIEQLRSPPLGFEEVIRKSFFLRKEIIIKEIDQWIQEADLPANYQCSQNTCNYQSDPQKYKNDLIKIYDELKVELQKLATLDNTFETSQNGFVRETLIINRQPSQLLQREEFPRMQLELQLPEPEKIEIDTAYEAEIQQKAFDPESQDVQNLMSRYIGVLGVDAVNKQSQASVLLYGLDCLGVEVAKNIVLSGVRRLTLVDDKLCSRSDQCGQFYVWNHDINTPRSLATIHKLKHLNPYVMVDLIEEKQISQSIKNYNIIVVTNQDNYLDLIQLSRLNKIAMILARTHSVFGSIINYFGESFVSNDPSGESIVPLNIENIDEFGLVTLLKGQKHNLQEGDYVQIQEVKEIDDGNESWNQVYQIQQVRLRDFKLIMSNPKVSYQGGGLVIQQKIKKEFHFKPLDEIISKPVYSEWMEPVSDQKQEVKRDFVHFLLSQKFDQWDPWNFETLQNIMNKIIRDLDINKKFDLLKYSQIILPTLALYILTTGGKLPPLEAYLGGLVCQEVLKFITQKYTPIQQVYVKNCEDVLPYENIINFVHLDEENSVIVDINNAQKYFEKFQFLNFEGSSENVKPIQLLFGKHLREKIQSSRLFLVGAGAIGCELLKNFAMCGFSTRGCVYVTDPDIIENSNLNRQFLFRSKHLRKSKSVTAAYAVQQMNPEIKVIPRLDKIGPQTEDIYHNHFFSTLDVVANALDNVQARLYVDGQCVENEIPLVESGTLGPKGHVQVIIPHETESYGSKKDPEETNDIPYCTLKMFPESELHCMEWARDKFESYFQRKPQAVCQVLQALQSHEPEQTLKSIQQQQLEIALRQIKKLPHTFEDCIRKGRQKFEKLFSNSIKRLLEAYPLDLKTGDGKLFWSAPKRAPYPLKFEGLQIALEFVKDFAILTATNYNIPFRFEDISQLVRKTCDGVVIPEYHSTEEQLQSIKNQLKPIEQQQTHERQLDDVIQDILKVSHNLKFLQQSPQPIEFEKDNDENHHVSFITSATNSRSLNYSLKQVDWLWCKLKAGRIVPAMATTTSCVSALQTIEILKIIQNAKPLKRYQNTFLNMAIPIVMVSEPAENEKFQLPNKIEYSFWTKHIFVLKHKHQKLYELLYFVEKDLGIRIQQLSQGERAFFVLKMLPPLLQDQEKLYDTLILDLLVVRPYDTFVDLNSMIEVNKEIQGPKIRILFK